MYKQFKEIKKKYKNKRGESEGFIDIAWYHHINPKEEI
jgi:hypothetical protein